MSSTTCSPSSTRGEKMKVSLLFSMLFPIFLGAAAVAHYFLKWSVPASWLAGVALSTTSVAVVYAVMLEFGLNRTDFGKGILAACFVDSFCERNPQR